MPYKHRLTWRRYGHRKSGGQWVKKIDGKRISFGTGKTKSDRKAYEAAFAAYEAYVSEQERLKSAEPKLVSLALPGTRRRMRAAAAHSQVKQAVPDLEDDAEVWGQPSAFPGSDDGRGPTLNDLIDDYLSVAETRRNQTMRAKESLPSGRSLSAGGYKEIRYSLERLREFANKHRFKHLDDPARTEGYLKQYRDELDQIVMAGEIAPSTANNWLKHVRPLFKHAYSTRMIAEKPRNLEDICRQFRVQPSAKCLDDTTIKKIWAKADDRMKAIMALGLNCGLYAVELADIRGKHIVEVDGHTYLAKRRRKTGVPYKIKLWPLTCELLQEHRDLHGADEPLFVTRKGMPLVHEATKSPTNALGQAFRKLVKDAGVEATWSHLRDTSATHVERIALEKLGDNSIVTQFLAHADQRTAKFYIDDRPETLETTRLDGVVDELLRMYEPVLNTGSR